MRKIYIAANRGMSLISSVIAMLAILFVIMTGFAFYNVLTDKSVRVENRVVAMSLAVSQVEDLRARDFGDAALSPGNNKPPTTDGVLPIEDVISPLRPYGWDLVYRIDTSNPPPYVGNPFPGCPINYLRIEVTCTYPDNNQVTFTAYMVEP